MYNCKAFHTGINTPCPTDFDMEMPMGVSLLRTAQSLFTGRTIESIKNAQKSGRPKFACRKEIVSKMKEIIEGDARFSIRDIARKVGISLSMVHLILKKHLKVRKIFARWVPHLLTDEQNRQRDKVAKNMLQMFQT